MTRAPRGLLLAALWLLPAAAARAGSVSLDMGPANTGSGGANPVGLPPGIPDLAVRWATDAGIDTTLSIFPGILVGKRISEPHWYASFGGGLLFDSSKSVQVGPGVYTSLGFISGPGAGPRFTADFTQTLGFAGGGLISPSAGRIGFLWEY